MNVRTLHSLEIAERYFSKDYIPQRNKSGCRQSFGSNIRQLVLGPNVSELKDSLITTLLEVAHTNRNVLLALTKDRHLSHHDACYIIDVHRGRWQWLSIKILQDSSSINELTAPFA